MQVSKVRRDKPNLRVGLSEIKVKQCEVEYTEANWSVVSGIASILGVRGSRDSRPTPEILAWGIAGIIGGRERGGKYYYTLYRAESIPRI